MPPESSALVVAYQRSKLLEIRRLYDSVNFDLGYMLQREKNIEGELDSLVDEFIGIRKTLSAFGADLSKPELDSASAEAVTPARKEAYQKVDVTASNDIEELNRQAELYLERNGLDITKDPLLQILSSTVVFWVSAGSLSDCRNHLLLGE
jgi:hypothetical protein